MVKDSLLPWWQKLSLEKRKKIVQISKPELLKFVRQMLQSIGHKLWIQYKIQYSFKTFEKELIEDNLPQYYLKLLHRTMESILEQLQLVKQSVQELHLSKQEQFFVEFDQCLMPIVQNKGLKDFSISLMDSWLQENKNIQLLSQYFSDENNPLLRLIPLFQSTISSSKPTLPKISKKINEDDENYEGEDETSDVEYEEETQEKLKEEQSINRWRESNSFFRYAFAKLFLEKIHLEFGKEESLKLQEELILDETSKKKSTPSISKPSKPSIQKQIQEQKKKVDLAFLNLVQEHVSQIVHKEEEVQKSLQLEEERLMSEMEQRRMILSEPQEIKLVQETKPNTSKPIKIQKQKETRPVSFSPKQDVAFSPDVHSSPNSKSTTSQQRSEKFTPQHEYGKNITQSNSRYKNPRKDAPHQSQAGTKPQFSPSLQPKQAIQPQQASPIGKNAVNSATISSPTSAPFPSPAVALPNASPSTRNETLDSFLLASQEWSSNSNQSGIYSVWGNKSNLFDGHRTDPSNFSPHLSPIAAPSSRKLESMFTRNIGTSSTHQTNSFQEANADKSNSSYHPLFSSINLSQSSSEKLSEDSHLDQSSPFTTTSRSIFSYLQSHNNFPTYQPFGNSPSKSTQINSQQSSLFSSQ